MQGNNCRIGIQVKQVLSAWVHFLGWYLVLSSLLGFQFWLNLPGFHFPSVAKIFVVSVDAINTALLKSSVSHMAGKHKNSDIFSQGTDGSWS